MDETSTEVTTLRDLVAQTLDAKGVLPKIKAELRANVFLALEENTDVKEKIVYNEDLCSFAKTENGALLLNLIREFLEFFHLEFTMSVFNPETRSGFDYTEATRSDLLNKWKIQENPHRRAPVLCHVIDFGRHSPLAGHLDVNTSLELNATYTKTDESSAENTPLRLGLSQIQEQDGEEISSVSESLEESPAARNDKESPANSESNASGVIDGDVSAVNSESNASGPVDGEEANNSIDLLVFTPVQKVKTVPKQKNESDKDVPSKQPDDSDETTPRRTKTEMKKTTSFGDHKFDKNFEAAKEGRSIINSLLNGGMQKNNRIFDQTMKGNQNNTSDTNGNKDLKSGGSSSLKDLPPLMLAMGGGQGDKSISEMRKLVEMVDFADDLQSSHSSKNGNRSKKDDEGSPQSPLSERTVNSEPVEDEEEEEEDISELLNSKGSSDGQFTNDETISRLSGSSRSNLDYVESI